MSSSQTDDAFDALSNSQRRRVLVDLLDHNPQTVEQLSATSREIYEMSDGLLNEFLASTLEIDGADKPLISLYHEHLPKLVRSGFIEWDHEDHDIEKGPDFDEIRPLLILLADNPEQLPDEWV